MVIIPDGPNPAVREPEVLPFESVAPAHLALLDGDEILVVDGISVWREPVWHRVTIENQVRFCAARLQPAIELRDCGLVFRAIRLDDDSQVISARPKVCLLRVS